MKGIIYKATDSWNGKVYIGQTVTTLKHRRREHEEDARNEGDRSLFHVALIQRNFDFKWESIDTVEGDADYVHHFLNVAEEYHILKCRAAEEDYGYNSTYGGYSAKRPKHVRDVISTGAAKAYWQYDLDGNFLRGWDSLREIATFYDRPKLKGTDLKEMKGQWHGFQWRRKVADFPPQKIGKYEMAKRCFVGVAAYATDGNFLKFYEKRTDVVREYGKGITTRDFTEKIVLNAKFKDRPLFFRVPYGGTYPPSIDVEIKYPKPKSGNPPEERIVCDQYDRDGNFVARYGSLTEAQRVVGYTRGSIKRICSKREPLEVLAKTKWLWRFGVGEPRKKIDIIPYVPPVKPEPKMEHRVLQYSLDGEYITTFENMLKASKTTGDSTSFIRKLCDGYAPKKCPNYQWRRYAEGFPLSIGRVKLQMKKGDMPKVKKGKIGRPRKNTHTPGQLSMF